MHAWDAHGRDLRCHIRLHLTLQVNVVLVFGELAIEFAQVHAEELGELAALLGRGFDIVRVHPDCFSRQTARQHGAGAVNNLAPIGRDFEIAHEPGIALLLQEVVAECLQPHRARS